jgi:uncharacterized protein (TIGR02217 family)
MFSTDIVTYAGGAEYRNSKWSLPLYDYDLSYNVRTRSQVRNIYEFFIARKGRFEGFRIKDLMDFTTASNHVGAHAFTDVTIGTGDGVTATFQLKKIYTKGAASVTRTIKKPVSGAIKVGVNGVEKTITTHWTVDTTTGIITFTGGNIPTLGQTVTAGFEFDTPVRFNTDSLADIEAIISGGGDNDLLSIPSIPLIEIRV